MQTRSSLQYSFIEGSFNYLVALNRGLTQEKNDREKTMEGSFIRLCRLFYYSQLPNKFTRIDHELHFIEYYLKQLSLRFQDRIHYRIDSDHQNIHWAIRRLELYSLLEKMIADCSEESHNDFSIHIDASELNLRKRITIHLDSQIKRYEKKLKVRKMKPNDSRFYMLDLPVFDSE